ncbi:helix-turn-helix domain-containing protein [Tenacibaculum amylolyticum]|uniref:helix-turn-helix domain-containing protein n=1 Tax=Tenacibaculum amylolyticum TaxID=104269 RepID=UPI003893DC48
MIPRFYLGDMKGVSEITMDVFNTFEVRFLHVTMHLQSLYYYIASILVLRRAKKIFFENHSNNQVATYKWLFQIIVFWMVIFGIALVKNILKYSNVNASIFSFSQAILVLGVLIITCWYILKALNNPEIFKGVNSNTKLVEDLRKEANSKSVNGDVIQKLRSFMDAEKPYLNPSLSIRNLAQQMKMPARELSIAINHDLNQHFFDFVNEYRIKRAMDLLTNETNPKLTVLEILYQVGFNSKSSFNTAFKKYTNVTPTQYRKQRLKT